MMSQRCQSKTVKIKQVHIALSLLMIVGVALATPLLATNKSAARLPPSIKKTDFQPISRPMAYLGQQLFFDKILSGNRNIACASCHHPNQSGADQLSLGLGEGARGLGLKRQVIATSNRVKQRIPRNTPALYNLGHKDMSTLFHDGRVARPTEENGRFISPAGDQLPNNLDSLLAVQSLFPMTSADEMAGHDSENLIAQLADPPQFRELWYVISKRVSNIEAYWPWFSNAYPELEQASDINISHIANALAAYMDLQWRAVNSPYDRYLRGETAALSEQQVRGLDVFMNEGKCISCHNGALLSDNKFHNIGLPAFGPGKRLPYDGVDQGRFLLTNKPEDKFAFRTPPLRNWQYTAPYGHNGAYKTIEGIIDHHIDPLRASKSWSLDNTVPPKNGRPLTNKERKVNFGALKSVQLPKLRLSQAQRNDLLAFMQALNDPDQRARFGLMLPPKTVASGISLD